MSHRTQKIQRIIENKAVQWQILKENRRVLQEQRLKEQKEEKTHIKSNRLPQLNPKVNGINNMKVKL